MSSDQDDNTLSGLPPLPSAGYQPDDGDAFTSFGSAAESVPGGPGVPLGAGSAGPPPAGAVAPAGALESPVADEDELSEAATGCVVMGPSGSGKTTLLAALDQACSCPAEPGDPFRLELVGGPGPGTKDLAAWSVRAITEKGKPINPTDLPRKYDASVTATEEQTFWRPVRQSVAHLVFHDGPGGIIFPGRETTREEYEKYFADREGAKFLRAVEMAETLVLCVDATNPQPGLISEYMQSVLAEVAQPFTPELDLPLGYRLLRKLGLGSEAPRLRKERRINAGRFLLLLTKVDQLLAEPLDWDEEDASGIEPPRPADLAAHLGPVQTACELLDESNLLRILNALKPKARLAVGLTSAWGFNPFTGQPFMEDDEPVGPSAQDRSQQLLNWRPFGVREALLFISAGVARGPVELVQRSALGSRLKRPELDVDVPPQFFDAEKLT